MQPSYHNLLTDKKDKKIHVFEVLIFFENILSLSVSRNFLQVPSLVDIILGNFSLSNSTIVVKDLISWKRRFEIILIDHCASDIAKKNIADKYKVFLYQCHPPYTRRPTPYTGCYISNSSIKCMFDLSSRNRGLFIYFWKEISLFKGAL